MQTCICCLDECFHGVPLLFHTIKGSNNQDIECQWCNSVCVDCALVCMHNYPGLCPLSKLPMENMTVDGENILEDVIAHDAIEGNYQGPNYDDDDAMNALYAAEEEFEEEAVDFSHIDEIDAMNALYAAEEEFEEVAVDFSHIDEIDAMNALYAAEEALYEEEEEIHWRRQFPCRHHFTRNGVVCSNGGCTNLACSYSHQRIRCQFGRRCNRSQCIYYHA